jgi:hypothetical protein
VPPFIAQPVQQVATIIEPGLAIAPLDLGLAIAPAAAILPAALPQATGATLLAEMVVQPIRLIIRDTVDPAPLPEPAATIRRPAAVAAAQATIAVEPIAGIGVNLGAIAAPAESRPEREPEAVAAPEPTVAVGIGDLVGVTVDLGGRAPAPAQPAPTPAGGGILGVAVDLHIPLLSP